MANRLEKPVKTGRLAQKSALFLHVYKCGGTSVASVMQRYDNLHVCQGSSFHGRLHQDTQAGHFEYGAVVEPEGFDVTFTCIRHPFARVASLASVMNDRRKEGCTIAWVLHIASLPGIKYAVDRPYHECDHYIWTHTRPISWYDLENVSLIMRQETLADDWRDLRERLGIVDDLPELNKGCKHAAFTATEHELAASIYRQDLEKYYA